MSTTAQAKRAAIAQLCSTDSKLDNLIHVAQCAGQARRQGASMLFLPEMFGYMGFDSEITVQNAEPPIEDSEKQFENDAHVQELLASIVAKYMHGSEPNSNNDDGDDADKYASDTTNNSKISLLDGLKTIARKSGLWISGGGMHESGAPSAETDEEQKPRVYNTHVIVDQEGELQAAYRKIHLFDVSIPEKGVNLRESATTAPGTELVLCDSPVGRLALTTCYDVRFPETYMELVKRGAQVLLVPSAFTVPTGRAHWHVLLRARAIESQCYVLASAQHGRHNFKRESYGHSLAVDPWGVVLADAGGYGIGEGGEVSPRVTSSNESNSAKRGSSSIMFCDIDLQLLENVRQRIPMSQHRDAAKFD